MRQNELAPSPGAKHSSKRIGRGLGSGHGRTAGKGTKGQKARAGYKMRPGFEGGQNPLTKSLPEQRGFTNIFRIEYATINVARLNRFEAESEVTPQHLVEEGLVKSLKHPIKILGDGELQKPLTVRANKFTQPARRKIEAAGGKAEEISSDSRAKRH
ncbi:MAG: 50S ribosomal protein L15 [Dehalococcoidia bacterium]|nr:MAG: 50S ribosomal protein L15 [Dehalococcoidia bacterium]